MSPLLFFIALEPLACAIHSSADICGVDFFGYSFKLNMYADDIVNQQRQYQQFLNWLIYSAVFLVTGLTGRKLRQSHLTLTYLNLI